jgi:hypothetical protein
MLTWARFLHERRGRGVLEADREDLEAFHAARRLSDPPTGSRPPPGTGTSPLPVEVVARLAGRLAHCLTG